MINKCGLCDVSNGTLGWVGYIETMNKNQVAKELNVGRMNGPREIQESDGWMKSENLKNIVVEVRSLKNSRHFWVV